MNKSIRPYLFFYTGCKCLYIEKNIEATLIAVDNYGEAETPEDTPILISTGKEDAQWKYSTFEEGWKIILRPLTSLSSEEVKILIALKSNAYLNVELEQIDKDTIYYSFTKKESTTRFSDTQRLTQLNAEQFAFLIYSHIDVFRLIINKLALSTER